MGGMGGVGPEGRIWAFLPEPPICLGFRIGTREVHNKLEKNRCVCTLGSVTLGPPLPDSPTQHGVPPQSFCCVCPGPGLLPLCPRGAG